MNTQVLVLAILIWSMSGAALAQNTIKNPGRPMKGHHLLELERILSISKVAGVEDALFDRFAVDKENVYLLDGRAVKIYRFERNGRFMGSFLNKGEGPGEFGPYPRIQATDDHFWVIGPSKIAKFRKNGELLQEYRFIEFFRSVMVVNEFQFIATWEQNKKSEKGKAPRFKKYLSLVELDSEKKIETYLEADNVGRRFVQINNRTMSVVPNPGILEDIVFDFNSETGSLAISLTSAYRFQVKHLQGEQPETVVTRTAVSRELTDEDKREIVSTFGNVPEGFSAAVVKSLPDELCFIKELHSLTSGHVVVGHVVGYDRLEWNIFDKKGRFTYILDMEIAPKKIYFGEGFLASLVEEENGNVYHEFRIRSLPHVFGEAVLKTNNTDPMPQK